MPHGLIASFKATLEEARQADLLLHVADASNPAVLDQISAAYQVLKEIGMEDKDSILAVNKVDRLSAGSRLDAVLNRYPNAIAVSARTGQGLGELALRVSDALSHTFRDVDVETGVENGRLMAYLAANGEVLSKRFNAARVTIHCRLPHKFLGRISEEGTTIRPHVYGERVDQASDKSAIEDVA